MSNEDSEAKDLNKLEFDKNQLRLDDSKQQVHMKSKIQTEMFVTNMLTLLLLVIMYDTSFFKPVYLGTSLTVNLAIMLVLTTIFTSEIEELAPMSQTKMINIWLIFNREDDTEEPPEKWKTGDEVIVDKKA